MKNKNVINNTTLDAFDSSFDLFYNLYSSMSIFEFATLMSFFSLNETLSIDKKLKLFRDEFPELYEKFILIGGTCNGSTKI